MSRYSELLVKFTGDAASLSQVFRVVNADLAKTAAQVGRQTIGFKALGDSMTSLGASLSFGVTAPMAAFAAASLKSAGAMEQTEVAFRTMLRSTTEAKAKLEELKNFAAKTPFQFPELADATRKMLALGFSSKETLPLLNTIGDAAAGLGLGAEGINRITLALGQMKAKGTAQAEEMRQLAEAGIPAWDALAKKLGVDVAEAMKMVENRSVSAQTAIDAVTEAMTARFGGGMEAQSKTLVGIWSNVKDAIGFGLADIGNALAPAAKALLTDFIQPAIDGAKGLAHAFAQLPTPVQSAAISIAALIAAAGPAVWIMGQLASSLVAIRTAVTLLGPALKLASETLGAMAPELGVIGAIVAVAYTGKQAWDEFASSLIKVKQNAFGGQVAQGLAEMGAVSETAGQAAAKLAAAFDGLGIKSTAKLTEELKRAKENLIIIQQAYEKGAASAADLAAAKDRVRAANELLHPSLRKTADEFKNLSGQMAGPMTADESIADWMGGISSALAEISRSYESSKLKDIAQNIYDVGLSSPGAADALQALAVRMHVAGVESAAVAAQIQLIRDAILELPSPKAVDLKVAGPERIQDWGAIDQAQNVKRAKDGIEQLTLQYKYQIKDAIDGFNAQKRAAQEISTVFDDLGNNLSKLAVQGGRFRDVMVGSAKEIGTSFLRIVFDQALSPIKKIMQDVAKVVVDLAGSIIKNLVKGAFGQLSGAITGCFGQLKGLGSALGSIFGGGASAAGSAAGAASSAGGSVASAAGSAASSGATAIVGAVAGVASAISGIIGNFQMAGMNKSLDVLVRHTLQITLQLEAFMKLLDVRSVAIHDRLMEFRTLGIGVWPQEGYSWAAAGPGAGSGGGITINNYNPGWIGFRDMDAFWAEAARQIKARL